MRVFVVLGFVLAVFVFTTGHVLLTTRSTPFPHETAVSVPSPGGLSADSRWFPQSGASRAASFLPSRPPAQPFTLNQQAWMAEHPVVTVSLSTGFLQDGEQKDVNVYTGLSLDFLRLLSQRTGLRFRMETDSRTGVDVYVLAHEGMDESRTPLLFTTPYVRLPGTVVTRNGTPFRGLESLAGAPVAVQGRQLWEALLPRLVPGVKIMPVSSALQGLLTVAEGRAAAFVGYALNADPALRENAHLNLQAHPLTVDAQSKTADGLSMAVRADKPELHAILQTALDSLTTADRQAISRRWLGESSEFTLSGRPFWLGLLVLQGVAGVLLLVLFWNFQLRRKVEERTRRLAVELEKSARTEILEGLNAELREAAEVKSRFLANISHEIRTPLHGIISFTELAYLKNQVLPRKHQRTILDLAYALLDIVNDTLDFSKIEAGGMKTDIGPFGLDDVILRVCDMTIHGSRARELACVVDVDPATPPALVGDASRLQQVLTNLMSNAVKFTPPGGRVHLQVRPASTRMAGGAAQTRLLFFVHDTGVGIAPEHLQRLFKPFGQVDASLTRQRGGTGLGLTIARHMVEKLDGEIWVESEPGQGSTFAFSLPFGLQEQVEALAGSSFVGMQALVVGGTDLGAAVLSRTLEALGFRVLAVQHNAVWRLAESIPVSEESGAFAPDVLVIDRLHGEEPRSLALPVLDALNRQFPGHLPVLFFGGPQEELVLEGRRAPQENTPHPQRMEVVRAVSLGILRSALRTLMGKGAHVGLWARPGYRIPDLSAARLLVVEDNPVNREIMAALLEDTHAEVHMAPNGRQALDMLASPPDGKPFDLVFLDIQMPDMDGYATIRAMRENGKTLPVVAITAHAMQSDKQRCLDAGMDAYLSKPFKQALLFDVMQHLLPNLCKAQLLPEEEDTHAPWNLPPCFSESVVRQTGLTAARFRHVLQSFVRSHNRDEALLRRFAQHVTPENLVRLKEQAHTLKGAAANLGAQDLRQAALALEREAAARLAHNTLTPFPRNLLNDLSVALTTVLAAAATEQAVAEQVELGPERIADRAAASAAASASASTAGTPPESAQNSAVPPAVQLAPATAPVASPTSPNLPNLPSIPPELQALATALREASPERVREALTGLASAAPPLPPRVQEQIDDYDYEAALEALAHLPPAPRPTQDDPHAQR